MSAIDLEISDRDGDLSRSTPALAALLALPAIDPAVRDALAAYVNAAEGAYAAGTVRALVWDARHFAAWCTARGSLVLPATPSIVAAYADAHAPQLATATLRRRIASIGHLHRAAGMPDPTKSKTVHLTLKRAARRHGTRPRQAAGITEDMVGRILATLGNGLQDQRDRALLLVARDLLARRSEVVALDVEHIDVMDGGGAAVLIARSKTDAEGVGVVGWLSPTALTALRAWLTMAGIAQGALFRSLRKGGRVGERLSADAVAVRLKTLAARAGLDPRWVSGHSARVGMAQDLAADGADLPALMQAGRWRSPTMPARYIEALAARRGAVARYRNRCGASSTPTTPRLGPSNQPLR